MHRLLSRHLCFVALWALSVSAAEPGAGPDERTLVDLMTEAELVEAIKREGFPGDQFLATARQNGEDRYYKCMQTFGHKTFCECLEKQLPWVLRFDTYVRMVTATPRELASPRMDSGYRGLIDHAIAVRNICVDSVFPE